MSFKKSCLETINLRGIELTLLSASQYKPKVFFTSSSNFDQNQSPNQ